MPGNEKMMEKKDGEDKGRNKIKAWRHMVPRDFKGMDETSHQGILGR